MKTISYWARDNKVKARLLIILIKLLLAALAIYMALLTFSLNEHASVSFLYPVFLLFIVAVFLNSYFIDKRKNLSRHIFYRIQTSVYFIVSVCSFLVIFILANNYLFQITPGETSYAGVAFNNIVTPKKETAAEILESLKYRDKSTLTRYEKRILKKEFKKQLFIYVKAKATGDAHTAGEAGLIILTILGALGLFVLIASLSCSLSCSGSDTAAAIILLLGTAGIIWLSIFTIRKISHWKRKEKPE